MSWTEDIYVYINGLVLKSIHFTVFSRGIFAVETVE